MLCDGYLIFMYDIGWLTSDNGSNLHWLDQFQLIIQWQLFVWVYAVQFYITLQLTGSSTNVPANFAHVVQCAASSGPLVVVTHTNPLYNSIAIVSKVRNGFATPNGGQWWWLIVLSDGEWWWLRVFVLGMRNRYSRWFTAGSRSSVTISHKAMRRFPIKQYFPVNT